MLLYSLLHLTGYDLPLDELKEFRQWGSRTPGHPERGHTPGVETTTGRWARGSATRSAWRSPSGSWPRTSTGRSTAIVDHRTWVFASDGDLMEGVASEAASLAGHLRLGKLTLIYDDNHITIDGDTALALQRGRAAAASRPTAGTCMHVARRQRPRRASPRRSRPPRAETARPRSIVLRTVIADPAPTKRNTAEAHGAPLGAEEVRRTKEIIGWPDGADLLRAGRRAGALARGGRRAARRSRPSGDARFERVRGGASRAGARELRAAGSRASCPRAGTRRSRRFTAEQGPLATRQASGLALQAIAAAVPNLVGGSADLGGSTGTTLKQGGDLRARRRTRPRPSTGACGSTAWRACLNGIAAHGGLRPFGSTFLVFSDYMKPAIRLAAIMRLPVIYIGTHDSIGLGEDGPTHQPVEHLAMLRAIPNLVVLRPADATETVEAWRVAMERTGRADVLVLTRQKLPVLDRAGSAPRTACAAARTSCSIRRAAAPRPS